jgi:hypothetical protein
MRCVSWDDFLASSEAILDEALRCGRPIYVRRRGSIVVEIQPVVHADAGAQSGDAASEGMTAAERWCAAQQQLYDEI